MKKLIQRILIMGSFYAFAGFILQCVFLNIVFANEGSAQKMAKLNETKISLNLNNSSLNNVFKEIEAKSNFEFAFDNTAINKNERLNLNYEGIGIADLLHKVSKETGLQFKRINNNISIAKTKSNLTNYVEIVEDGSIVGKVSDSDGNPLIGASVKIVGTTIGTSVDVNGEYTIGNLKEGTYSIETSFVGYLNEVKSVKVGTEAVVLNFTLVEDLLNLDEIVITGTRSKPRTVLSSPVPIDNITATAIARQGNGDITENLKNIIPSFNATPLTGDGAAFVRPTSMRGLPPDETLVLVNSKRRHRSALISHFGAAMNVGAQAVDIGHIPSIAIKNLEVLRDGAAAQYGSDAIAGVLNFILKDASEGVEVQAQVGKWYGKNYGSETDYKVSMNFGLPLTEKGFINISGEYTADEELSRGVQHASAVGVVGAKDPAMNWGRPESRGLRAFWNSGIDVTENAKLYSFGNFARTYGNYSFFYRAPGKSGVLTPLPNDPQDPSKGNFCWCDVFPAGFTPRMEGFQTDFSTVTGIKGNLGAGINYDVSTSFGMNRINYVVNETLNPSWGVYSQTAFQPGDLKQNERNFNIDLSKELSDKVNLAIGLQTRKETYTMFAGDYQSWAAGPWTGVGSLIDPVTGTNYVSPSIGANGLSGTSISDAGKFEEKSWGAYADLEYDISENLLVQLAYRFEDYENFGNASSYKLASRYTLADWLTLRGSYSTGFRAPTAGQANVTTIITSFDGVSGQQVQEGTVSPTSPLATSLGGTALVPETAKNISVGLASKINNNLSLTLDYYQIMVDDRIIKSRSLPIVNANFSELAFYTNSLNTKTSGLDAVLSWKNENTELSLAYNYNNTEVRNQTRVGGELPVSEGTIFNLENNLPKSKVNVSANRNFGSFNTMVRANYYGGTIDERGTKEEVGSEVLIDLELTYSITEQMRLILGANNVLNNYPDEIDTRLSQGMPYPRRTPIGYNGGMVYFRVVFKI